MASFMTKGTQILVTAEAIMKTINEFMEIWGIYLNINVYKYLFLITQNKKGCHHFLDL